ncbi:hypothetical protein FRC17_010979 [Serendipita sp. 399]|nr:hypothetical protein FRC17_010979 [Serendipita sp. 399]
MSLPNVIVEESKSESRRQGGKVLHAQRERLTAILVPSMASATERSPLIAAQEGQQGWDSRDRNEAREAGILNSPGGDEDEEDKPSPWTTQDKLAYSVLGIFILASFIITFIVVRNSKDREFDWRRALRQALGGGLAGAAAMVLQVFTLMPLRTIMNYQYRYGTGLRQAAYTLYQDGGYLRYYSGLGAALVQAPVARFGDAAANVGALALLESNPTTMKLPVLVKTFFAAVFAGAWRMTLTPIDTLKTTLQTQGRAGLPILKYRMGRHGIGSLWWGALGNFAATLIGFFPWFGTYNYLQGRIPPADSWKQGLVRQAVIGFIASITSDTISNFMRVLKTYRQVNATLIGYRAAARAIIRVEGLRGLFGRGLKTRILANGAQGLMFSVLWKIFLDMQVLLDIQVKPLIFCPRWNAHT